MNSRKSSRNVDFTRSLVRNVTSAILKKGLHEAVKGISILTIAYRCQQLARTVGDRERRKSVGDDSFPRTCAEILFVEIIGEMHVGMAFIRQHPILMLALQHNGQVVTVVKHEGREDAKAILALLCEPQLFANLASKILYYRL